MTRKLNASSKLPSYTDGVLTLHEVKFTTDSYQRRYIAHDGIVVHFRQKSVYNKTKIEFKQIGIEVMAILNTPVLDLSRTKQYCVVLDDEIMEVQNATINVNSNGYREHELTVSQTNIEWEENLND